MEKDILTGSEMLDEEQETSLAHVGRSVLDGAPIGSGRYRYGSGEDAYQHVKNFHTTVQELRRKGMKDTEIAKHLQMTTSELRSRISKNKEEMTAHEIARIKHLRYDRGMSTTAIAKALYGDEKKESTVRNRLKEGSVISNKKFEATENALKAELEKNRMLDVGPGTELALGISATRLKNVLTQMEKEGYTVHRKIAVDQYGKATNQQTTIKVLTKDDISDREIYDHLEEIKPAGLNLYSDDRGKTFKERKEPEVVHTDRVYIKYADDYNSAEDGRLMDGVIQIRRGVPDLNMGNANYVQGRIRVDNNHFMKGMIIYSDDIPEGYDVVYNTNRKKGAPLYKQEGYIGDTVFKKMKDDPANPFGANIKSDDPDDGQLVLGVNRTWKDKDGVEHESAIRIVNEEGNWNDWSRNISAQMLSKQPPALAKRQLDLTYASKREQLDDILSLTNPTVKQKMLEDFANSCDSDAVHLKAYGFPGQPGKVILPVTTLPENQIYAPSYENGTQVVLIRYPHASITEIPSLTVNNNHKDARKILGQAVDAVGISPKTAQQLSGADFDGDTVYVIPNNNGDIKFAKQYKELQDFDTKEAYPGYPGMKVISHQYQQKQMGVVTNLITDMTVAGAKPEELIRAIKHSMVIIDAEKHQLDWKRSEQENDIRSLIEKYQVKQDGSVGGASTLISRAKSTTYINQRRYKGIDPETGEKIYEDTGKTNWKGQLITEKSTQMADTKDARTLISGHNSQIERVYANYANQMKALALEARKAYVATENLKYDPEANKHYAAEVKSLEAKLRAAKMNAPLERKALILANVAVKQYIYDNPSIKNDGGALKKLKGRTLNQKRLVTGATKQRVKFTDREWEAIQAGAVHHTFLKELLRNADTKEVKQLAMPREKQTLSPARAARIKNMLDTGYTQKEIANMLDVPLSQVETVSIKSR
jgi:hypothetical protein